MSLRNRIAWYCIIAGMCAGFISCAHSLTFETRNFERTVGGGSGKSPDVSVTLSWPEAAGGKASAVRAINDHTQRMILSLLASLVASADKDTTRIEPLVDAFVNDYTTFREHFPDSAQQWSIAIEGNVVYVGKRTATVRYTMFAFTGGAHPINKTEFRIFDCTTGSVLSLDDIVTDKEDLRARAEQIFRMARNIPRDGSLSEAGYRFDNDRFSLPEQIGLAGDGLILFYDYYEIGPRPLGVTEVTIPKDAIVDIVKIVW